MIDKNLEGGSIMRDWLMAGFCIICWLVAIEVVKDREGYTKEKIIENRGHSVDRDELDCSDYENRVTCKKVKNLQEL